MIGDCDGDLCGARLVLLGNYLAVLIDCYKVIVGRPYDRLIHCIRREVFTGELNTL